MSYLFVLGRNGLKMFLNACFKHSFALYELFARFLGAFFLLTKDKKLNHIQILLLVSMSQVLCPTLLLVMTVQLYQERCPIP